MLMGLSYLEKSVLSCNPVIHCVASDSEKSSLRKAWTLISVNDIGCSESTKVLKNVPGSLEGARSLGGEYFDPSRECVDHYQDVVVALFIDWKRTDVVYV